MKAAKFLALGMLFALPLCGCTPANTGKSDDGKEKQQEETKVSLKDIENEAKRIASEYFEVEVSEIEIGDYEDESDESYVSEYKKTPNFCDIWDYPEEDVSTTKSMLVGLLAKGSKAVSDMGFEEDDEGVYCYYYKGSGFGYNIYLEDWSDETGDCTFFNLDIFAEGDMNAYDELMYQGGGGGGETGGVVFDFSKITNPEGGSSGGYSYATDKGSGASKPAYNSNSSELRLYANNSITISGDGLTQIVFDANTCGHDKTDGVLTASAGSMSGFTWTGSASSVTFTVSSGKQVHINSITINGGGSGGGGGGDHPGEEFFVSVLETLFGETPVYDEDYFDDDGLYTMFPISDITADVDDMYAILSPSFNCDEPEEYEYDDVEYYGFYIYSDDEEFYIDLYGFEETTYGYGLVCELDLWSMSE